MQMKDAEVQAGPPEGQRSHCSIMIYRRSIRNGYTPRVASTMKNGMELVSSALRKWMTIIRANRALLNKKSNKLVNLLWKIRMWTTL
jgi:hypothetical protein